MNQKIYITRKDNWHDIAASKDLSITEWASYVQNDPEMQLNNFTEVLLESGECFRYEDPGAAVWFNPYPNDNSKVTIYFDFTSGNILVSDPDEAALSKMKHIAFKLGAKVQGEEGEVYQNEKPYSSKPQLHVHAEKTSDSWKAGNILPGFLRPLLSFYAKKEG